MLLRTPSYYSAFHCLAEQCKDNCCIGWEIDIDERTARKYAAAAGAFGLRLRAGLVQSDGQTCFALQANGRCAFLNEDNLCDIQLQLGEDALCDICARHPRHYTWLHSDITEVGIGLACEEAARLIVNAPRITLTEREASPMAETPDESICENALLSLRNAMLRLAQFETFTLEQRMALLLTMAETAQPYLERNDANSVAAAAQHTPMQLQQTAEALHGYAGTPLQKKARLSELLELLAGMDTLDDTLPLLLRRIQEALPRLIPMLPRTAAANLPRYENLLWYFLYRYGMQAAFDGDLLGKVHLAVTSVWFIVLADALTQLETGACTMQNTAENAKLFSKEIEYAPANMARMADASFTSELFTAPSLLALLL